MLTCEARRESCLNTLARFARTDWPGPPRVHVDPVTEKDAPEWGTSARVNRLTEAFAVMLRVALAEPGLDSDWLLLLEDDLDFHPQLARHVGAWAALWDENCCVASLFNSGVRPRNPVLARLTREEWGDGVGKGRTRGYNAPAHAFAAQWDSYLGSQALLLRRWAARVAVRRWAHWQGLQCQRLAKLFCQDRPLWVHKPSLVQHVATDSSWGANIKHAVDFDRFWEPQKPGQKS